MKTKLPLLRARLSQALSQALAWQNVCENETAAIPSQAEPGLEPGTFLIKPNGFQAKRHPDLDIIIILIKSRSAPPRTAFLSIIRGGGGPQHGWIAALLDGLLTVRLLSAIYFQV